MLEAKQGIYEAHGGKRKGLLTYESQHVSKLPSVRHQPTSADTLTEEKEKTPKLSEE